ncbi:hypothetical protein BYT27DRAFT_7213536 [Phlegmacium glaucopus]|nr:hypothetical protein BYT27DRAFT_7213536 [Phlegmacium glaucopus]
MHHRFYETLELYGHPQSGNRAWSATKWSSGVFEIFEENAVASARIAQVHKAKLWPRMGLDGKPSKEDLWVGVKADGMISRCLSYAHIKVFNSTMIVPSSPSMVKDILDKTGPLTAGRTRSIIQFTTEGLYMAMECASTGVWRRSRTTSQMLLVAEAVDRHLPTQEAESYTIYSKSPGHIVRTSLSLIASLGYGKRFPVFKNSGAEEYPHAVKLANEWAAHCDLMKSVRNSLYDKLLDGYIGATLRDAGAETLASFIQAFVLALLNAKNASKTKFLHKSAKIDPSFQTSHAPRFPTYGGVKISLLCHPKGLYALYEHITQGTSCTTLIFMKNQRLSDQSVSLSLSLGLNLEADIANFRDNFEFGAGRRSTFSGFTLVKGWDAAQPPLKGGKPFDLAKNRYLEPELELAPKPCVCDVKVREVKRAEMIKLRFLLVNHSRVLERRKGSL